MNSELPDRERFETAYQGKPPWDIGRPQPVFEQALDLVRSPVLDAGCGTGENALLLASRGHRVTGVDFLEAPIGAARAKAEARGIEATLLVHDALALAELAERFETILDCGLLHVFGDEDRARYVQSLAAVAAPECRLLLLCFSDREPGTHGPRRVTEQEIRAAFAVGWEIESIEASRFATRPDAEDIEFSPGGPHAWFCVIRRSA